MTPAELLDRLVPLVKAQVSPRISAEYIDGFVSRMRPQLLELLAGYLERKRVRAAAPVSPLDYRPKLGVVLAEHKPLRASGIRPLSKADKAILDTITAGLADPSGEVKSSRKIDRHPSTYMAAHVERIGDDTYSVAHYFRQGGDSVADPDITFILEDGDWYPATAQLAIGKYYVAIDRDDDGLKYSAKTYSNIRPLADLLLRNIKEQQDIVIGKPIEDSPRRESDADKLAARAAIADEIVREAGQLVATNSTVVNALANTPEHARMESDRALAKVMTDLFMADTARRHEPYRLFSDNPEFRDAVSRRVFNLAESAHKERQFRRNIFTVSPEQAGVSGVFHSLDEATSAWRAAGSLVPKASSVWVTESEWHDGVWRTVRTITLSPSMSMVRDTTARTTPAEDAGVQSSRQTASASTSTRLLGLKAEGDQWLVTMNRKVSKDDFIRLLRVSRAIGGNYSKRPYGFLFSRETAARSFISQIDEVPEHSIEVSRPAPTGEKRLRPGWTDDPELLARVQALADNTKRLEIELPKAAAWLVKIMGQGGSLPPQVRGQALEAFLAEAEAKTERKVKRQPKARQLQAEGGDRPPKNDREREAAEAVVSLDSMNPDRAREKNFAGFDKADGATGHAIAMRWLGGGVLTDAEWEWARAAKKKYRRQVGAPVKEEKTTVIWKAGEGGIRRDEIGKGTGRVTWTWVEKNLASPEIRVRWWEGTGPRHGQGEWKQDDTKRSLVEAKKLARQMAQQHGWGAQVDGWAIAYHEGHKGNAYRLVFSFGEYGEPVASTKAERARGEPQAKPLTKDELIAEIAKLLKKFDYNDRAEFLKAGKPWKVGVDNNEGRFYTSTVLGKNRNEWSSEQAAASYLVQLLGNKAPSLLNTLVPGHRLPVGLDVDYQAENPPTAELYDRARRRLKDIKPPEDVFAKRMVSFDNAEKAGTTYQIGPMLRHAAQVAVDALELPAGDREKYRHRVDTANVYEDAGQEQLVEILREARGGRTAESLPRRPLSAAEQAEIEAEVDAWMKEEDEREARFAAYVKTPRELYGPMNGGGTILVSRDVTPGMWRASRFDKAGEPTGHLGPATFADVLKYSQGDTDIYKLKPIGKQGVVETLGRRSLVEEMPTGRHKMPKDELVASIKEEQQRESDLLSSKSEDLVRKLQDLYYKMFGLFETVQRRVYVVDEGKYRVVGTDVTDITSKMTAFSADYWADRFKQRAVNAYSGRLPWATEAEPSFWLWLLGKADHAYMGMVLTEKYGPYFGGHSGNQAMPNAGVTGGQDKEATIRRLLRFDRPMMLALLTFNEFESPYLSSADIREARHDAAERGDKSITSDIDYRPERMAKWRRHWKANHKWQRLNTEGYALHEVLPHEDDAVQ